MMFGRLFLVSLALCLSGLCLGQSKTDTVSIKTSIKCDHCQECETCGMMMEKDLYLSNGVLLSVFNPSDTTITVVFKNRRTDLKTIKKQISKLGYDADDIPADPKGYQQLDDCCRKEKKVD